MLLLCFSLVPIIAAAGPARAHEARQGPISTVTQPLSMGPGPASVQTSSSTSTTPKATTMSPTPSSEPSLPSSSTTSPMSSSPSSSSYSTSSSSSPSGTSPAASPSSTETSSSGPSPSPSITIAAQNMTTCTSGLISWNYSGTTAELLLSITNIGLNYAPLRIKARQSSANTTVQQQLAVTNTSAQPWTWPSVNVTQGWYEIEGVTSTVNGTSEPFFISNGTDVACLAGTSPQASSTASPGSTSALSATSNKNVAGIVGGVVGGVVGVVLIVIAALYLRKRKRQFVARGGGSKKRGWGSLKSTNSSIQPGGGEVPVAKDHFHAHSESTGGILQDDAGGKASATATPGGSDEDIAVTGEEKPDSPATSSCTSPVDALNIPMHYGRRVSMYSIQTPTTPTNDDIWSRTGSRCISNQSLEQQAQRIRSSMETSMQRRSGRLSMPTLPSPSISRFPHSPTFTQPKEEYPLSPMTPTPVNRSISTSAVSMTTRRASRKPVPHYDPSLLLEDTNADSASTFTAGAESSQSHGTGTLTGVYGTPLDKTTFGDGRPVHYLIPDMPSPQQD